MKALLMYRARDFDLQRALAPNEAVLSQDLALEVLLTAMALKDKLVFEVARKALLGCVYDDLETIEYRQDAVRDCLANPATIRRLYELAGEAQQRQRKVWSFLRDWPTGTLQHAVSIMEIDLDVLKQLRQLADRDAALFKSEAFSRLFATLARELTDDYFALIEAHLKRLRFRRGVLISAVLGKGFKGAGYVLSRPIKPPGNWFARIFAKRPRAYRIRLAPRDQAGADAMAELHDRGVAGAANALAKSAEHVVSFFEMLRTELAFYVGCLNLHERLQELGAPVSFPLATAFALARLSCHGLYDVSLALSMRRKPVGNDVAADDKTLIVVTGANQGGKTTFLRSLGLAQLMMQCGMFAPAERFQANIVDGLFTHFKREEDATMKSGKFDEELSRMNDIVSAITPHPLILFNESFAATNEREGSEIARQIVSALLEQDSKVVFVSHQYEFAHGFFRRRLDSALFLRADREADGRRTFKLVEGEPLSTSFGEDLYRDIFLGEADAPAALARRSHEAQ